MDFTLAEEHRMLKDLVTRYVRDQLMPLESKVLAREASGQGSALTAEEMKKADTVSKDLGLWGLDAPADLGGMDLPAVALIGVNEELGRTVTPYTFPPDSPNLRMLLATVTDAQRERYLEPYVRGETRSAIAISEPGAGSDPSLMSTRAEKDGDSWVLNGRKIWISRAAEADFTIVMAVTDKAKGSKGGMSAFLVDKGTPGFNVTRKIPMLAGTATYEVALEDCRIPAGNLLGQEGAGFAPMQLRLGTRRLQIAAWCIGMCERALEMMCEYAPQRVTFGAPLASRQTIQNWVADAAISIRACRLMAYEIAWKLDQGQDVRTDVSMIKVFATEMATRIIDQAMQCFGAMGVSKELPLYLFAEQVRCMRIFDGPTEIHRWVVARSLLRTKSG